GAGGSGGDGGPATSAHLGSVYGIGIDSAGSLYIADAGNHNVRKVTTAGTISTVAGTAGVCGYSGDNGPATSATLCGPQGVTVDSDGNLYIADSYNVVVRKVDAAGTITTFAGDGNSGSAGDGGPASIASFVNPTDVALDTTGNLYVADYEAFVIRKIAATNIFPNTSVSSSSQPQNVFLALTADQTISSISVPQSSGGKQEYSVGPISGCTVDGTTVNLSGTFCTFPITFTPGYPGNRWIPLQVVSSAGHINFPLEGIGTAPLAAFTPGIISTIAGNGIGGYTGDGNAALSAELNGPFDTTVDSAGNVYIADNKNNVVRKISASTGFITTVAGNGTSGFSGDGGPATSAQLNTPTSVTLDGAGNLYISENGNNRIRMVNAATGLITTVAGSGSPAYSGDGGPATSAGMNRPGKIAIDVQGNLYIPEETNHIRKVAAGTGIITTVAGAATGSSTCGGVGDGGPATSALFFDPNAVAVDNAGNLYITDIFCGRVRKVTAATGIISTIAGGGTNTGDGGPATSANLGGTAGLAFDSAGNLYISAGRIRKVNAAGTITTVAGTGTSGFAGDGGPATSAKLSTPRSVALDAAGNLYIADFSNNRIRKVDVSHSALAYPTATTVGTSDSTDDPQTAVLSNIGNTDLTISPPSSGSNP